MQTRSLAIVIGLVLAGLTGCASQSQSTGCPKLPGMARGALPFAPDDSLFHVTFRSRLGAAVPQARTMVLVHSITSRYYTTEWSIIATRGDRGWVVSEIGEERPAMAQIRRRTIGPEARALSPQAGARLDALLANPCLYQEPTLMLPVAPPRSGADYQILELVSPAGHRVVQTVGPGMGLTGQVLSLLSEGIGV